MIVSLVSVRGSPGVTSWSLLLAAAWPAAYDTDRVVVEADIDGGVAAARYGVGATPGTAQLLSALRGDMPVPDDISPFARHLGERGWLVPGPETAESAAALWNATGSATNTADALAADARLWVVDAGRARPGHPLAPVLRSSSAVVVFAHGDHASLVQLPARVEALRSDGARLVIVAVVGSTAFEHHEIAEFCDASVLRVPGDSYLPRVAGAVWTTRRARRSAVWRAAVAAATSVAEQVTADAVPVIPRGEGRHDD